MGFYRRSGDDLSALNRALNCFANPPGEPETLIFGHLGLFESRPLRFHARPLGRMRPELL